MPVGGSSQRSCCQFTECAEKPRGALGRAGRGDCPGDKQRGPSRGCPASQVQGALLRGRLSPVAALKLQPLLYPGSERGLGPLVSPPGPGHCRVILDNSDQPLGTSHYVKIATARGFPSSQTCQPCPALGTHGHSPGSDVTGCKGELAQLPGPILRIIISSFDSHLFFEHLS